MKKLKLINAEDLKWLKEQSYMDRVIEDSKIVRRKVIQEKVEKLKNRRSRQKVKIELRKGKYEE